MNFSLIFFTSGMKALTSLVVVAPHYAVDYQMIVMECLENPDAAIQRKVSLIGFVLINHWNTLDKQIQDVQELAVKIIDWQRYSHGMWPNEVYFSI